MAYKHYQLRETCPNPKGGAYADPTEAQIDRNLDVAIEAIRNTMEHTVLPLLLENHSGDVKKVAQSLAIIGADALHGFMVDNRAEGQKQNLAVYSEMIDCFTAQIEKMQHTSMLKALGVPEELIANANVHIIHI